MMNATFTVADDLEVQTAQLMSDAEAPDAIEVVVMGEVVYTSTVVRDAIGEAKELAVAVEAIYNLGFGSA